MDTGFRWPWGVCVGEFCTSNNAGVKEFILPAAAGGLVVSAEMPSMYQTAVDQVIGVATLSLLSKYVYGRQPHVFLALSGGLPPLLQTLPQVLGPRCHTAGSLTALQTWQRETPCLLVADTCCLDVTVDKVFEGRTDQGTLFVLLRHFGEPDAVQNPAGWKNLIKALPGIQVQRTADGRDKLLLHPEESTKELARQMHVRCLKPDVPTQDCTPVLDALRRNRIRLEKLQALRKQPLPGYPDAGRE